MIQLTRLNNNPLMVNSELIKFVEQAPDTLLTLVNGEKIVVLESPEQVVQKIVEFRRLILAGPTVPSAATTDSAAVDSPEPAPPTG